MAEFSILTDDFAQAAAAAGRLARLDALASGHSVVFTDHRGRLLRNCLTEGGLNTAAAISFDGTTTVIDPDVIAR